MIHWEYSFEASELFKLFNLFNFNFDEQLLIFYKAAETVKTVMHFKVVEWLSEIFTFSLIFKKEDSLFIESSKSRKKRSSSLYFFTSMINIFSHWI